MLDRSTEMPTGSSSLHEAFLERASARPPEPYALSAFLVLRLVDSVVRGVLAPSALDYQAAACDEHLAETVGPSVERNYLHEIVRIARATRDAKTSRILFPPLLAYAFWLEDELRLPEALDVLDTAWRISDGRDADEEVRVLLQRGRTLRKASRYDDARGAYAAAMAMAEALQDRHSSFMARVGTGIVLMKVGRLRESEAMLLVLRDEAKIAADHSVEGHACQNLSVLTLMMHEPKASVQHAFRALRIAPDEATRFGSLVNLGVALKELGRLSAAADAFQLVLREGGADSEDALERRGNTLNELLEISARLDDRLAFERHLRELRSIENRLIPDTRFDFHLKLGEGYAQFGDVASAEREVREAIALAETHHLNAYLFEAEARLEILRDGDASVASAPPSRSAGWEDDPQTDDVCSELRAMAEG